MPCGLFRHVPRVTSREPLRALWRVACFFYAVKHSDPGLAIFEWKLNEICANWKGVMCREDSITGVGLCLLGRRTRYRTRYRNRGGPDFAMKRRYTIASNRHYAGCNGCPRHRLGSYGQ